MVNFLDTLNPLVLLLAMHFDVHPPKASKATQVTQVGLLAGVDPEVQGQVRLA